MADKIANFEDYINKEGKKESQAAEPPKAETAEPPKHTDYTQEILSIEIEDPVQFFTEEERKEYYEHLRKQEIEDRIQRRIAQERESERMEGRGEGAEPEHDAGSNRRDSSRPERGDDREQGSRRSAGDDRRAAEEHSARDERSAAKERPVRDERRSAENHHAGDAQRASAVRSEREDRMQSQHSSASEESNAAKDRSARDDRSAAKERTAREDRSVAEDNPARDNRRPRNDYVEDDRDYDESFDDEEYEDEDDSSGVNMDLIVRIASIITGIIILAFIGFALKVKVYDRYFAPDPDEVEVVATAPALPEGYTEKNDVVVVTGAELLNIRSTTDTSSNDNVVGMVPKGTELNRLAVSDDGHWAIVDLNGQQCYASMKYLEVKQ